jgi:uncharacterized protein YbbK (DUF523 family)
MTFTAEHRRDGAGLMRPRIGVSSCLLGEPVRFNGGHSRSRFLTDELSPHVEYVPFCPELAIGLGSPRESLRLTTAGRLINRAGTTDRTTAIDGLLLPGGLDGYVVKSRSPSCGLHGIPRYGGGDAVQPADHRGRGAFAGRLTAAFPSCRPRRTDGCTTPGCAKRLPSGCSPAPGSGLCCPGPGSRAI